VLSGGHDGTMRVHSTGPVRSRPALSAGTGAVDDRTPDTVSPHTGHPPAVLHNGDAPCSRTRGADPDADPDPRCPDTRRLVPVGVAEHKRIGAVVPRGAPTPSSVADHRRMVRRGRARHGAAARSQVKSRQGDRRSRSGPGASTGRALVGGYSGYQNTTPTPDRDLTPCAGRRRTGRPRTGPAGSGSPRARGRPRAPALPPAR